MGYSKARTCIVCSASVAVFILLLSFSCARAADTADPPAASQNVFAPANGELPETAADDDAWKEDDDWDEGWDGEAAIADPLEPLNRVFFHFNDKLYYWVLKPVSRVYSAIVPEDVQILVRNFFDNLKAPTMAINCLLQGQVKDSSVEVARFALNSTVGILGFGDFAKDTFGLVSTREDTGQTLGYYGAGGGFYINWPFLGPSNVRDSIGLVGDTFLHPLTYIDADWEVLVGVRVFERVNQTALTLGDYELLVETAADPYASLKDVYEQYRNGLIKE